MNTFRPIPDNESERIKALQNYEILDTISEKEFDRLTELASLICDAPISLVSLIDKDRQWFKSKIGLDVAQTERNISICQYAIMDNAIFEVADTTHDDRFKDNPLITGDPNIRFYAGYPLIDGNGYALGTLCVIDRKPRKLTENQSKALRMLGEEVVSQIISRKNKIELHDYAALFETSIDMVCVAKKDGYFKRVNPAFTKVLGWTNEELMSTPFLDFVHPDDLQNTFNEIAKLQAGIKTINFINRYRKKNGEYRVFQWVANPDSSTGNLYSIARDVTESKRMEAELSDYAELFKTSIDMVCLWGSDGYFKKVNSAFTYALGWSEEELLSRPYSVFVHPEDLQKTTDEVMKLGEGVISHSFINRLVTQSGEYRTVQWSCNPSKISGFTYAIARDITEIKKNEEDLRKSLYEISQLQKALDEAAIVSRSNSDYEITYVNNKFCEISGYTREELIGVSQMDMSSSYNSPELIKEILKTITKGDIWKGQARSKKKNGEIYWVDITLVPLMNEYGRPYEYITIRYDVTLQKRKAEQIQKLAEFQNAILNGTDYSIIATDTSGTITAFNQGAENMLGYSAEDVIGKVSPEVMHDIQEVTEKAKLLSQELNITIKPGFDVFVVKSRLGKPDVNEWTYITKNGDRKNVLLTVTTLYDSYKNISGYLGIARDITLTKKSQELLRLSEERHSLFFENAQGLMCTHDQNGKFLTMNKAGASLIGYTSIELMNKTLFDVTPLNVKGRVEDYLRKIFKDGSDEGLMKVIHKTGKIKIWYYKNILVKDAQGNDIAIGNAIDISDRIVAEKQLQKAKLLAEKSVLAKDSFLANMSHEIRTPMNAILGFYDILKTTKLNAEQNEYLSAIGNAGENLIVIINDILDFSKIESGHLVIESNAISIRSSLDNVKRLLLYKAKEGNLALSIFVENDVPDQVLSDTVRFNQIFVNLVGNAIKFTENGKVELFCQLHQKTEKNCVLRFKIKDTGIGIPRNKLRVVFERFKQADDNTTRKFGGTGLGLSITKKLVELFGGNISVESEVGVGTEFTVLIPFELATQKALKEIDTTSSFMQPKSLTILLAEDNELNQKLARHILESVGFIVDVAFNGQIAIDLLKVKTYDIILMDLQMPVMDGYLATSFIRNVLKLNTPIIAMTAHSLVGEKEKCERHGMNHYLSKPYKAKELIDSISELHMANVAAPQSTISSKSETQEEVYNLTDIIQLSNNDPEFVSEMITVLIKQIGMESNKIKVYSEEGNIIEVKRIAHKIKSSFALFGMQELVRMCLLIETEDQPDIVKSQIEIMSKKIEHALITIADETSTKIV